MNSGIFFRTRILTSTSVKVRQNHSCIHPEIHTSTAFFFQQRRRACDSSSRWMGKKKFPRDLIANGLFFPLLPRNRFRRTATAVGGASPPSSTQGPRGQGARREVQTPLLNNVPRYFVRSETQHLRRGPLYQVGIMFSFLTCFPHIAPCSPWIS